MSDSRSSWKQPYLDALRETDKKKLAKQVYAAEEAILTRLHEMSDSAEHHEERREIQAASADLLAIQINKLGWPAALL
jgi:hypothetical protein